MTTAIVVGGGICGLASAAAALNHFEKVIILDKDDCTGARIADETVTETGKRRSSVPQYTQPHVLLSGGAKALERLLPGFLSELAARGARHYDAGEGFRCFDFGGNLGGGEPQKSGLIVYGASRRLLSETLQDMVVKKGGAQLEIRDKMKVNDLLWSDKNEVIGVKVENMKKSAEFEQKEEELLGDLVIICDGRKSQLPQWLKKAGVDLPEQLKVDCKMSYTSRWMKLPEMYDIQQQQNQFYSAVANGRPVLSRGGMAMLIEQGLAQFVLTGFEGERAPLDHEGWMEYAASLPDPAIHNLAVQCQPLGPPITRFASACNIHPQYHRMQDFPAGMVVLGDAAMALNPAYGQGMTVAAQSAACLERWLGEILKNRKKNDSEEAPAVLSVRKAGLKFQKELQKLIEPVWGMACSEDLSWKGTVVRGNIPTPSKMMMRYMGAVSALAKKDPEVWVRLLKVAQLEASPASFYAPSMLWKVAKSKLVPI